MFARARAAAGAASDDRASGPADDLAPDPADDGTPRPADDRTRDDGAPADPLAGLNLDIAAATPGAWLELAVSADHEAVEAVSEILSRAAPGGTSVEPAFELVEEGLAARIDIARPARVRAHLPLLDVEAVRGAVGRADRELGHLQAFGLRPIGDLTASVVHEADWANAWKAHFPVLRIGRRIVIRPTWRRHRRRPGDVVLALDPGMAFGTGLHPTTRLCLATLESLADRGILATAGPAGGPARVLDVGSGSGILSIAAAMLGAGSVLAVDVDPIAVDATAANARRNRLGRVIRARAGSAPSGEGPFDIVLANLIASLLITLADGLVEDLRPGGTLLASGIFENREAAVVEAFRARGLEITGRLAEGDWVALEARRPASVDTRPAVADSGPAGADNRPVAPTMRC
jgi:ribosomal protein L11 methyltransferase